MEGLVLAAALVALLAAAGVAVRAYFLLKRIHRMVDSEIAPTVQALRDTLQEVRGTVGKLDKGVESLASMLERVDRVTEKLEPESMARAAARAPLKKLASWIGGVRRGLASIRGEKAACAPGPDEDEAEAG
jgi:hypothetical protein